jgi:hypothetical protein
MELKALAGEWRSEASGGIGKRRDLKKRNENSTTKYGAVGRVDSGSSVGICGVDNGLVVIGSFSSERRIVKLVIEIYAKNVVI